MRAMGALVAGGLLVAAVGGCASAAERAGSAADEACKVFAQAQPGESAEAKQHDLDQAAGSARKAARLDARWTVLSRALDAFDQDYPALRAGLAHPESKGAALTRAQQQLQTIRTECANASSGS